LPLSSKILERIEQVGQGFCYPLSGVFNVPKARYIPHQFLQFRAVEVCDFLPDKLCICCDLDKVLHYLFERAGVGEYALDPLPRTPKKAARRRALAYAFDGAKNAKNRPNYEL
jgi:hypothetical protein